MTLKNLENCFNMAKKNGQRYIGMIIEMPDFPCHEIIINEYPNFDKKLEYYKKAYNEDLTLKAFNKIKIIGFTFGQSFADIERDLITNA